MRRIQLGYLLRLAPRCPDLHQRPVDTQSKQDHTVTVPRAPATIWRVRDVLRRSAGNLHFLELPFGEKADPATVWGPERHTRPLSPAQHLRGRSIERPHPELIRARGIPRREGH